MCNGCHNKQCTYYYRVKETDEQYLNKLSAFGSKMHYSLFEIKISNNDFYNLVIQTKSIYHSLIEINSRGFNFNIKTIYRQIIRICLGLIEILFSVQVIHLSIFYVLNHLKQKNIFHSQYLL